MGKHKDVLITKTRTLKEIQHDYSDCLAILMNVNAHSSQKHKALQEIKNMDSALFDRRLVITITVGIEKR